MNFGTSRFRKAILSSASAMAVFSSIPVLAQTASPGAEAAFDDGAPEILVTARKREERLIDVPISITAFSGADIQKKQIRDLRDIAALSPNVSFQDVGGRNTPSLFIRGVTNTATTGRLATTAVFVDGIYVLGGLSSVNTSDVARVEVIKGPQNAYFGRNTFAGAINFISKEPSNVFGGEVSVEGTARGSYNLTASIEGPIIEDKIMGRIVASTNHKAAMYRATDGGELGREDTRQISGTLLIKPSDRLSLRLRADYQHDDDSAPQTAYLSGDQYGNNCAGKTISGGDINGNRQNFAVTLPYFCGGVPTLDKLGNGVVTSNTSLSSVFWSQFGNANVIRDAFVDNSLNAKYIGKAPKISHMGMVRNTLRLAGSANYEISDYLSTVLNIGYNKNDTIVLQDSDRSDYENVYAAIPGLYRDFSAEFRLQSTGSHRFRWMVGANYFSSKTDYNLSGDITFQVRFSPNSAQTTGGVLFNPQNANGERAKVMAGFASAEYDIFDSLTLSGEIRYQKDRSKTSPDQATSRYATFKDWLPRVILKYQPDRDWSMYATWSRGVLPGQFNTQYINATPAERAYIDTVLPGSSDIFSSQKLDNYEIGMKQSLFGRTFQYSLALYKMKWGNLPSSSAVSVPGSTTRFTGLVTAGNATLKGVEFEGVIRPTRGLDINFGVSYQQGKYNSYTQGLLATGLVVGLYDFKGKHLARMPDWQGNVGVSYSKELTGDWNWFAGAEAKYTGKAWDSEANIVKSDDFARVNARIGVENGALTLELFAKNLFNDNNWDYAIRNVSFAEQGALIFPFQGNAANLQYRQGAFVGAPDKREVGFRAKYKF